MKNPTAYALLIGVGDYRAFDPSGDSDLKGPPNDVAGWLNIVYGLGIPRDHIRICVSPALPGRVAPGLLEGVDVRGSARADIVDGLKWLAAALDGEGGTKAVLTWSGHGTRTAEGLVLCPSDIRADGDTLINGLTVSAVGALLDARAPATRLTAFVDTCHDDTGFDALGTARGRGLPWAGAAKAKAGGAASGGHRIFGDLVVTSSQPGTVSYDMPVLGGVRGAFSWAASNVIRRYGLVEGVEGKTSGLTFEALAETCGRILQGMVVHQTPRFVGDPEAGHQRVFSAYGDDAGLAAPQALPGHEIWPGMDGKVLKSKLYDVDGNRLGTLYITDNDAPSGWTDNRQYWVWKSATHHDWPNQTFVAHHPGTTSDAVPTSHVFTYETSALSPKTESKTLGGWSYIVSDQSSGKQLGYLRKHSDHLTTYSTQNPPPDYLASTSENLQFTYHKGDISAHTYAVARDYAK